LKVKRSALADEKNIEKEIMGLEVILYKINCHYPECFLD
jgi:hypothetical protein